jgi:gliding motility-associated-like protein
VRTIYPELFVKYTLNHQLNRLLQAFRMVSITLFVLCAAAISRAQTFSANSTSGCTPMGVVISVTSPAPGLISSYLWTITAPDGSVQTAITSTYVAIFSLPGGYDVSLTINGNQNTTINNYITVYEAPTANFTTNDHEGCFPLCVDFSDISISGGGTIVEWSWDFGDGGISNEQNPTYCYDQVGSFTPIFSVEDEHGCFDDLSMPGLIQVVADFPQAQFSSSTQLDCNPPVDVTFTNTSTGVSSLTSSWDFGDGGTEVIAGVGPATYDFNGTGTFDVCLTVTDEIGCQDQTCLPVTIFGTAQADFTANMTQACEGQSVAFTNTTTPIPPNVQWDFNGDGITDSNNLNATFGYATSGTYNPTLTVTYSSGCTSTVSGLYEIEVIDGVNVAFTADTLTSCVAPFTVNFTNESVGSGTITYEWFVNNVLVANTDNYTHTFANYGIYDIKLISTNEAGCHNQLIMNDYIVVQEPTVDFDNPASVCTNEQVPIFNVLVTTVDPVAFYYWDFNGDGNTDAEGFAPVFMYTAPGQYNITLTIETVNGCTASYTNSQTINVLTEVSTSFTSSTNITCAGEPVEFCIDVQPGNTFSWNFFDGSGWVIMPLEESCIFHDYTDTGYFDLTVTVFNGACNITQTIENYIYVSPPVALFEYAVNCDNLMAVEFLNSSIEADSVVWDFGDGSALVSDTGAPTHIYAASGEYTVTITAYNDELGCPDEQSAQVLVAAPNASLVFDPPNGCPPLNVGISNGSTNTNWLVEISNGDVITANWLDGQQFWQVAYQHDGITDAYNIPGFDADFWPTLVLEEGGFHDVTVTVVNSNGCETTLFYDDAIQVTSNPDFAAFTTSNLNLCEEVSISFEPVLPDLQNFQWIFSDGTISTQENPLHIFNPPYNYNLPLSATLTATDSSGCVSTVTQQLNVSLPPTLDFIVLNDPSCEGDEVQFINESEGPVGTTYSWNFGDAGSSENISTVFDPVHLYANNGTYEVCLTGDNGMGCVLTYCNPEGVHIISPEVTFDYNSNINNCLFGVQFENTTQGTIIQSSWNFGDDQTGFGNNVYHTYPIGVYDVTLTVINQYGCVGSLFVPDILSYGNQVGPFTQVLDSANCAPFDVDFAAFNPSDSYFSYFWDFNDGSGDPTNVTQTQHTYLQPGSYCPSLIMTDPNGCTVLIACQEPIVVDEFVLAYQSTDYLCDGDTLHIFIENGESYSWDDMSQITQGSLTNEFYLHPADDTQFLLTGTYADCVRTDTLFIEVKDLPIVTLDMPNSYCFGDSIVALNEGLPADPPGVYFIDGLIADEFDPTMTPETLYEITYQYTDTFLCVNSTSLDVFLHQLPVIDFPDFVGFCEDHDTVDVQTANPSGGVYTWLNDTIVSFDPAIGEGNYVIEYFYTDQFGCSNEADAALVIYPLPDALISFDDVCQDVGFEVDNQSTIPNGSIATVQWNFGPGGIDTQFDNQPVYFPAIGTYPFSATLTSDQNCITVVDSVVNVWAVPVVHFTPDEACQFTEQLFVDQSTIQQDSITTWLWNVEGQTINSPDSLLYGFQTWGTLDVSLTTISNHGCDDTLSVSVVVHPAPVVDLEFEDGCLGIESHFHANASVPIGGIVSEEWQFGDSHPFEFDTDVDNLYDSTGVYYIVFTASSNLGCTTVVNDSIQIYGNPEIDFIIDPDAVCSNAPFSILDLSSVESPSEIAQWLWVLDGETISTSQTDNVLWSSPGTYDLFLEVISNHGCASDTLFPNAITVYPSPIAGFATPEQASMFNPIVEISNNSSEDVVSWMYDFGDGSSATFPEGEHLYETWDIYTITQTVENAFGCADEITHQVEITPDLLVYVPNAFTPDGNGHNDTFFPVMSGFEVTLYEFIVFDRWGAQVFSSTDPEMVWDGSLNGTIVQDGVYSWKLLIRSNFDVTIHEMKGSVTILR